MGRPLGYINHYLQEGSREGELHRFSSPRLEPHRTPEKAAWAAERVERGTGGAVVWVYTEVLWEQPCYRGVQQG